MNNQLDLEEQLMNVTNKKEEILKKKRIKKQKQKKVLHEKNPKIFAEYRTIHTKRYH